MDRLPRLEPLTVLLGVRNGLAQTLLPSYKRRSGIESLLYDMYRKYKTTVPIVATQYLSFNLEREFHAEGQDACFDRFVEGTEIALQNNVIAETARLD
jgi:hypothetical protein